MTTKIPNTICKNRNCNKGADGGRRKYYTCRYCVHSLNWRSVACCPECYDEYMKQVAEARKASVEPDIFPERLDMSHEDVVELVTSADTDVIVEETKAELADEIEDNPTLGFGNIVDKINEELEERGE